MQVLPFSKKSFSPDFQNAAGMFLQERQARNLSQSSIVSYREHLRYFHKYLAENHPVACLNDISAKHVTHFILWLGAKENSRKPGEPLSSTTIRKAVISIKTFFKYLYEEGLIENDFYLRIRPPKSRKKVITSLSMTEIQKLLEQPDKTKFDGFRDYVMIMILCDCGLRLSEILNLETIDINYDMATLKVLGKGDKERIVPLGRASFKALKKFLLWRGDVPEQPKVFVNLCGRKLDSRRFQRRLIGFGEKAGIGHVHPHLLRHSFAKNYVIHGGDPFSLQMILGHTTLYMVKNYVTLAQQEVSFQHSKHSVIDNLNITVSDRKRCF